MKHWAAALLALPLLGAAPVATNYQVDEPLARPAGARMVWSDEFDGRKLDPRKWRYDTARNKAA